MICAAVFGGPIMAETIGFVDLQKVFVNYKETEKAKKGFEKKTTRTKRRAGKKAKYVGKGSKRQ